LFRRIEQLATFLQTRPCLPFQALGDLVVISGDQADPIGGEAWRIRRVADGTGFARTGALLMRPWLIGMRFANPAFRAMTAMDPQCALANSGIGFTAIP
jgi:hypothetical protein